VTLGRDVAAPTKPLAAAAKPDDELMTIRNLDRLLHPTSLAVIGGSDRPNSVGAVVMKNLADAGFAGAVMPINPKHEIVGGLPSYADVADLPIAPDLAVVCTPPDSVPAIVDALGRRGTRAAVVITAGLARPKLADGRSLQQAMLDAARPHLLRVLGPNCVGLLVPGIGLNASFAHVGAKDGSIAFVSQSGALCTIVLDWANSENIGFSHFISLGDAADVDLGDVIDYLAADARTRAILLYMESVTHARKFLSAARAAARNKPVMAIKAGRTPLAAKAAASHTGALADTDEVFSAAFRRAGIVRVDTIEELFEAAETLARSPALAGDRLAIVTNGGGPGVMAVDAMATGAGRLANLSATTIGRLDAVLPATWSRGNPVDIIGDAPRERYGDALRAVLDDGGVDAVLVMHAPTAIVPSIEPAKVVIETARTSRRPVFACWLGRPAVRDARTAFAEAGIASFESPDGAIRAFNHMLEYRATQSNLLQTPTADPQEFSCDRAAVRRVIAAVHSEGRDILTEPESKIVLGAYGVPMVETIVASDPDAAVGAAERLGFPVALKILSPDISHKSDVGGVVLGLATADAVRAAMDGMLARVRSRKPAARIDGVTVQRMADGSGAFELIAGATVDAIFGPVILFGHGGTAVELIGDRAVGLPPLNRELAGELISRTRIARLLAGFRDRLGTDRVAIERVLVQISQLMADFPEVCELDINPLLADDKGVLGLDARIRVATATSSGADRFAIRPYPQFLAEEIALAGGHRILLRPIRPEDEPAHREFISHLSASDLRFRFFGMIREIPHSQLARFAQIDYDREMAFLAIDRTSDAKPQTIGVVRAIADPDNRQAEFAIVIRSDLKRRGLGSTLMRKIICYCRSRGTEEMVGQILVENTAMRKLARQLGFIEKVSPAGDVVEVQLSLTAAR
jgi:acetyltransferase